jgi:hypothetical protein
MTDPRGEFNVVNGRFEGEDMTKEQEMLGWADILASIEIDDDIITVGLTSPERDALVALLRLAAQADAHDDDADLPTADDVRGILPLAAAEPQTPSGGDDMPRHAPQTIETAPRDGTHILAWRVPIGIRVTNNTHPPTVVHWFDDPDEPGFYTSVNERAPEHPFNPTHWERLPDPPLSRPVLSPTEIIEGGQ